MSKRIFISISLAIFSACGQKEDKRTQMTFTDIRPVNKNTGFGLQYVVDLDNRGSYQPYLAIPIPNVELAAALLAGTATTPAVNGYTAEVTLLREINGQQSVESSRILYYCPTPFALNSGGEIETDEWILSSVTPVIGLGPNLLKLSVTRGEFTADSLAAACPDVVGGSVSAQQYLTEVGPVPYTEVLYAHLDPLTFDWQSGMTLFDFAVTYTHKDQPWVYTHNAVELVGVQANCPNFVNKAKTLYDTCEQSAAAAISAGSLKELDSAWNMCLRRRLLLKDMVQASTQDRCNGAQVMQISQYYEDAKILLQDIINKERIVANWREKLLGEAEEFLKASGRCATQTFTTVAKAGISSVPGGSNAWKVVDFGLAHASLLESGELMDIGKAIDMLGEWGGFKSLDGDTSCTGAVLDVICGLSQEIIEQGAENMIGNRAGLTAIGKTLDKKMATWKENIDHVADSMPAPVTSVQNATSVCRAIGQYSGYFTDGLVLAEACGTQLPAAADTVEAWAKKFEDWAKLCGMHIDIATPNP